MFLASAVVLLFLVPVAQASEFTTLDAGAQHVCFVTPAGTVRCWGANEHGQLGDGTNFDRHIPVEVLGLSGVVALSAGSGHSCALKGEGEVWCWGDNDHGQLGDGTTTERDTPVQVMGLPDALEVVAGGDHTCAITEAYEAWCWGDNDHGQLGDGTTDEEDVPVRVVGMSRAFGLALGSAHTCAWVEVGEVACWGDNDHGQLGDGTTVERHAPVEVSGLPAIAVYSLVDDVAAGKDSTCVVVFAPDRTWCWGANDHGQLGDGTTGDQHLPVEVPDFPAGGTITVGGSHACVGELGWLWCWGDNEQGQLGDGTTTESHVPVRVSAVPIGSGGLRATAGGSNTCALSGTEQVFCWGANDHGQLGDGATMSNPLPTGVKGLSGPSAIATGGSTSCAVPGEGSVTCWGEVQASGSDESDPSEVAGISGVTGVAVGATANCAATVAGKAWCWGRDEDGQLGDGGTTSSATPLEVSGLTGASAVAVGGNHACALTSAGDVWCWGANGSGQLGDGTEADSHVPVEVSGLSGATAIAAGSASTCALTDAGKVWCWGSNSSGRLGDGTTENRTTPVEVSGLSDATAIAGGAAHFCAVATEGKAWCWGANGSGQLGDGTEADSHVPVEVSGLSDVTAITAGGAHTCALTAPNGAWCWGSNGSGQLGDGTSTDSDVPVEITRRPDTTLLAAGGEHTCAVTATGLVECWGGNGHGQLGDGSKNSSDLPVEAIVEKRAQAVTFGFPVGVEYHLGDPDIEPNTSFFSDRVITYRSATEGVCTVVSRKIHLVGLGQCVVVGEQTATARYAAGVPRTRRFGVQKAVPTLASTSSGSTALGGQIGDIGTLAGGFSPAGTIAFRVYGPDDPACSGIPIWTSAPIAVAGNGSYAPPPFTPTEAGTYVWTADYSGDSMNEGATSDCGEADASITVLPPVIERTTPIPDPTLTPAPGGGVVLHYTATHPRRPNALGGGHWTFVFSDPAPGAVFQCRLDGSPFSRCSPPQTFSRLKRGRHVYRVKATFPSGEESAVRKIFFYAGRPLRSAG